MIILNKFFTTLSFSSSAVFVYLAAFVYTPYLFLGSYTQPWFLIYAGCFSLFLVLAPNASRSINKHLIFYGLISLAFLPSLDSISQLAVATTIFLTWLVLDCQFRDSLAFKQVLLNCCRFSFYIQATVSLIQAFFLPSFLVPSSLLGVQTAVLNSGRGVIGLTPEPTHNALHLFLLVACIFFCSLNSFELVLSVFLIIICTKSSTLLLVLILALILVFLSSFIKKAFHFNSSLDIKYVFLALCCPIFFLVFFSLASRFDTSLRIFSLIRSLDSFSLDLLLSTDGSSCARLQGLLSSASLVFSDFLMPHSYNLSSWTSLVNISNVCTESGTSLSETLPSGYFSQLYYFGFLLSPFCLPVARQLKYIYSFSYSLPLCFVIFSVWLIPFFQFYFSDPILVISLFLASKSFIISSPRLPRFISP